MTARVPLTKGYVAVVDDADADCVLEAGTWSADVKPTTVYGCRRAVRTDGGQTTIRLHNFLTGWPFVDHIDGDGLNNRRSNLRPADHRTNAHNRAKGSGSTSAFKGVWWESRREIWVAQIRLPGSRRIYLGQYADPSDAARAYDSAAIEYFGQFARLNFPEGGLE